MKVTELKLGVIYNCRLSGKQMLVCEVNKQIENPAEGEPKFEKVKVGKYVDEMQGVKVFKVDELFDGQLEQITNLKAEK